MNRSTALRIEAVKSMISDLYEPGRQDRNKRWVWRHAAAPLMGISLRTFSRYVNTPDEDDKKALRPKSDPRQLSLFPEL